MSAAPKPGDRIPAEGWAPAITVRSVREQPEGGGWLCMGATDKGRIAFRLVTDSPIVGIEGTAP